MTPLFAPDPFELWFIELLDGPSAERRRWLSTTEHERAARFVFERDRRRYLAAHCGLRELLGKRSGLAPASLHFVEGPYGKPSLDHAGACAFNMSHSEDVALIAMADAGEIGVDVEMLRPMPDALSLARQNFSASENDELLGTLPSEQSLAFLRGWTRKEACLKALGSGLSLAPDTFTAGLGTEPRSVCIPTPAGPASVRVHSFMHGPNIVGSLAIIEVA